MDEIVNRHVTDRVEPQLPHADLVETGWFSQFWGPCGQFPVQLVGRLTTGEHVYFRARGGKITLEIAATAEDWSASRYLARFEGAFSQSEDYPFGASTLEPEKACALIKKWLPEYLARRA